MKKLIYKIEGYTVVCNPETEEVEQKLSLAKVTVDNPTDEDITRAAEVAYNGEYNIEDDGIEEVVEPSTQDDTDAMLIDHEYRLTLLELGITE